MLFDNVSIYSMPFVGVLLILLILSLSNHHRMFTYQLYAKRKKRYSMTNDTTINFKNSHAKIHMNPFNLDTMKYIRNGTVIPLQDDEELIKSEVIVKFPENGSIELRLEQDFDSDNDSDEENDD